MTWISPLKDILFGPKKEVRELIPEIEEKLLAADVGVATAQALVGALQSAPVKTGEEAYEFLKKKVEEILKNSGPGSLAPGPNVFFFVGSNGVGKTTTIGKLAHFLKKIPPPSVKRPPCGVMGGGEGEGDNGSTLSPALPPQGGGGHGKGSKVMLVAADTYRAAAKDQLKIWADRSQSDFVFGADNADPASVVFDGCAAAKVRNCDVVLIDTAGRLQTKTNLMEELKKMVRVAEKAAGRPPDEIFLVLDATTGQNGLSQARLFLDAVPLTGLILTKYDSTAKGGILISVVRETGLPLRFVGVGEKIADLKPFDPHEFVSSLFA